ncbi:PTS system fructose-specific EIIABC component [Planctomyces sp. SH-PL14]|nr:PTS system fructose-specific EIIABC component [Planctomyces sp. SH-PL14]
MLTPRPPSLRALPPPAFLPALPVMASDWFTLEEISRQLGRDLREIEKLVQRGRIPAHKRGGEWLFQATEVSQWLEQEMRSFSDAQLASVERSQQAPGVNPQVPVTSFLRPEMVEVDLQARTKRSVLEGMVEVAGRTWKIWEPAAVLKAVQEREELMSTAYDSGVAIPHPRQAPTESIEESVVAFGRTATGIPFGAPNGSLTDLFFLVVCRDARTHLQVLARLGRMLQQPQFLSDLRSASSNEEAYGVIQAAEQRVS